MVKLSSNSKSGPSCRSPNKFYSFVLNVHTSVALNSEKFVTVLLFEAPNVPSRLMMKLLTNMRTNRRVMVPPIAVVCSLLPLNVTPTG